MGGLILGFSGSRFGLSERQHANLYEALRIVTPAEVHHGDCVGADAAFHSLCVSLFPDMKIVIHPPTKDKYRAWCRHGNVEIRPAEDYEKRDKLIAYETERLWGCPNSATKVNSGTWKTIGFGLELKRQVMLFEPGGVMRWLSE